VELFKYISVSAIGQQLLFKVKYTNIYKEQPNKGYPSIANQKT